MLISMFIFITKILNECKHKGAEFFIFPNFLFQLSIFVKCHVGLSLGDKEATQLSALQSVCGLSNNYAVTNH